MRSMSEARTAMVAAEGSLPWPERSRRSASQSDAAASHMTLPATARASAATVVSLREVEFWPLTTMAVLFAMREAARTQAFASGPASACSRGRWAALRRLTQAAVACRTAASSTCSIRRSGAVGMM